MNNLNQDQLNQVEVLYKHYKKTDLTRSPRLMILLKVAKSKIQVG